MYLNIFPKAGLTFSCHQQKIQKLSHLRQLNDRNSGSNHDKQTNDIFLSSTLSPLTIGTFLHIQIRFNSMGFPHLYYNLVCIIHVHAKDDTFKPDNTDVLFLQKFAYFWYITCFAPNLAPIWLLLTLAKTQNLCA